AFRGEPRASRTVDRRALQNLADVYHFGRVRVAVHSAVGGERSLDIENHAHFGEHIGAVGYLVVDAQTRLNTVIERFLERWKTLAEAILRVRPRTDIDGSSRFPNSLPREIGQCSAMVVGNVGAKKLFVPKLL